MSQPMSVNRLIANHANAVREAVISASAQRTADAPRLTRQSRQGRGSMQVTGAYAGATDRTLDVEVIEGSGSQLRTSTPIIRGVGNGQMTVTAVDAGAVPETVTFTLADLGDPEARATLPFYGVTLMAKTPGEAGNTLTLTVERRLTLGAPIGALLTSLSTGTSTLPDARWDFGAATATGGGIPADAPRLMFGTYPSVHRHWREWAEGVWSYRLDPALPYDLPADTPVYSVTGDYRLTLSDGTSSEEYTGITHYDVLSAMRARSQLIEVVGTVVADTAPGGQAVTDVQLRTDAYALPVIAAITGRGGSRTLDALSVDADAVTENIILTCRANTIASAARWAVSGGASGALPDAVSGVPYANGPVSFTIPRGTIEATTAPVSSRVTLASRESGESVPSICIRAYPGARAVSRSVTFTYTRRPPTDCDCSTLPMPRPNAGCLGADLGESGMALDPAHLSRLQDLYDWRATFQGTQIDFTTPATARAAQLDMDLCDQVVGYFAETLEQIYASADALAGWDAEFARLQSEFAPMISVGRVAPRPIAIGMSVGALGKNPINSYTYQLARVQSFMSPAGGETALFRRGMEVGTIGLNSINQRAYRLDGCVHFNDTPNSPGGDEVQPTLMVAPDFVNWTWPTNNGSVTIRVVTGSQSTYLSGQLTQRYEYGYNVTLTDMGVAGQSGATTQRDLPALSTQVDLSGAWLTTDGATFTFDTAYPGDNAGSERSTWICRGLPADLGAEASVDQLARRYEARMDMVMTLAGLVPKSDASRGGGDGCWRDRPEETFYWEDESGVYLPAFNNQAYVSSRKGCGTLAPYGAPYSTQEFGFGLAIDCVGALKEGDKFTITVNGSAEGPYREGDRFTIPIIGAAPARFSGGSAGSSAHTWSVNGSVGGGYPDWIWEPTAPTPYTAGPLDVALAQGGIPFERGDQIRVDLEGGRLRWRFDAGDWTEADIYDPDGQDLGDGLTLLAIPGPAPSFMAGDAWRFQATATYGPDRLRAPREGRAFGWDGAEVTLAIDLGAEQPIEALLLAMHTLPSTAGVWVAGSRLESGVDDNDWLIEIPWREGPILAALPSGTTARRLTIAITGAGTGAEIGWLWAGVPWSPTAGASALQHIRQYGMSRGSGRNPSGRYSGRGTGGRWAWDLSAGSGLLPESVASLLTLLDHVAEQGLEWVCLVPDIRQPERATLAQIDTDAVTLTEELGYALDGQTLTSVDLPFRAVLR